MRHGNAKSNLLPGWQTGSNLIMVATIFDLLDGYARAAACFIEAHLFWPDKDGHRSRWCGVAQFHNAKGCLYVVAIGNSVDEDRRSGDRRQFLTHRRLVDRGGIASLLDPSFSHDRNKIGAHEGFLWVVRHDQRRGATGAQCLDHLLADGPPQSEVEPVEGLVKQHEIGLGRKGARQRRALLLAARQLMRIGARQGPRGR